MSERDEWVGALVPLPSYITGEGEPFRPVAVMWVDAASHFILDSELVHPDEALGRAPGLFLQATRQPKHGRAHTPARLRVSDATLAAALRGSIGDVEIVVAPTPEIAEIATLMTAHLRNSDPENPSFIGPDMTAGDVATMFAAAARLYRAAPWGVLPADVCIGVSCDLLGIVDGAMVVVGQSGQAHGFSLFGSLDKAMAFYEAIEANERGESPDIPGHIMFGYDAPEELPDEIVREVAEHRWDVASRDAYPSPSVIDTDRIARGLTRVELYGISAIMSALAELVETEPGLADAWERDDAALTWNRKIETPLGMVEVELRAPVVLPGDDGELDEEDLDDYAEALLDELSRVPGVSDAHLHCAEMLIVHAGHAFDAGFPELPPQALQQLLFEYIPATVALEPDMAPIIVEAAQHLMTLGAEKLGIETAKECRAALAAPELPARLARAMADETRFAPAKAMIMQGIREGYDLTSELGVAAWVEELSRRAQPKRKAAGSTKAKRAKPARPVKAKTKAKAKTTAKPKARPRTKAAKPRTSRRTK